MNLPLRERSLAPDGHREAVRRRASGVRRPGFVRGVRYVLDGAGFILGTRSMWGFAVIPALLTGAIFWLAISAAGDWIVSHAEVIAAETGRGAYVGAWLRHEASPAWVTPLIAATLVVCALVQPLCALALDIVTREQGWRAARQSWMADPPTEVPFRSFEATMCALGAALPLLGLLTLAAFRYRVLSLPAAAIALVVAALSLAWNFVEYPLSRRELSFGQRARWMRRHIAVLLGFGLTCAVLLVIPGLGLFVLPVGIAGAARLVIDCERAARPRKKPTRAAPPLGEAKRARARAAI